MGEKLSSDELGAAGEAEFEGLCARAKLVCNKSNRDVTGWDFVVEFPMPRPGPSVALDQRPPTSCCVQLKSTAGRDPVSLRLSSAERLAKDVRPAFIVVFRLSPDGQGVVGYLVHLLGPALARVLKRLRTAHANKSWDVNHARLSFDYRKFGVRRGDGPRPGHARDGTSFGSLPQLDFTHFSERRNRINRLCEIDNLD